MLSAHSDEAYIANAVNSGAMGYLIKQTSSNNVCHAIRKSKREHVFQPVNSKTSSQTESKKWID